ncbi:Permease of the drug/metabolite transporter (DMT) superfamily [Tistlia consotensis]|uniref:Permease of the drug/metabolite transporter (DMT) superfamily n=1 Tax=Tistlia consotensis USBA 355 TaxID=560819 RepID=A0A1Y6CQE8_9PROT|nr:Permease of the drug/metabolite transporter (DMT) superfamily [Tistlia consotensis USBA 355]SNS32592.1 Permease of the drug/metabolite transporter (DMT) superfamily [Tistlia consotensis]
MPDQTSLPSDLLEPGVPAAVSEPIPVAEPRAEPEVATSGDRTVEGIALLVLAVGLFSIMDAAVKWLGAGYPTLQIVFFRSFFAFVPLGVMIWRVGGLSQALLVRNPLDQALRCLFGLTSMVLFFYSYSEMRLADAIAIGFAAPVFVTALSMPLLGEAVGWRRWLACLVGFGGVLVMLKPGAGTFEPAALAALLGTLTYALAILWVRKLSKTESNVSIVIYFTLTTTLISGLALPFVWITPSLPDLALLIGVGILGGIAQIVMTQAYRLAEVSVLVPFDYTAMVWATGLGWLVWGEIPGANIWIGFALVLVSGLYIVQREAQLRRKRGLARRLQVRR